MEKAFLRSEVLHKLTTKNEDERKHQQDILFGKFMELMNVEPVKKIGLYYGRLPEIETYLLCKRFMNQGLEVDLPRVEPKRQLSFRKFLGVDSLEVSSFGVLQPKRSGFQIESKELDLIVVPGLAFQHNGNRIGFGGGYYDRFLSIYPNLKTISFAFPEQIYEEFSWNKESHDIQINTLITIEGIYEKN